MKRLIFSKTAIREIDDCLVLSGEEFGKAAAIRYRSLIQTALQEILENSSPLGSQEFEEYRPGARLYHLRHMRKKAAVEGVMVKRPRHFIIYVEEEDAIRVLRILHDSMDLPNQTETD